MNEGTASGPHHEDRSDAAAGRETEAPPSPSSPQSSASGAEPPREPAQPLHPEDPYATPPYGGPGPWAPAPPVQRPVPTPPQGVTLPAPLPPPPAPQAASQPQPQQYAQAPAPEAPAPAVPHAQPGGPWERYDPWAVGSGAGVPVPGGRKRGRGRIVLGAVLLALVAGGVGGGVGAYIERDGGVGDVRLPQVSGEQTGRAPDSVAGIAHAALPGVVTLHVRGGGEEGTGTGFVLDRRGHLLTNNHVVEAGGADGEISVTFSGGDTATGHVVGRDSGYDLAVVKVDGVSGLEPLTLGNSDDVRVGDPVVAIGAPFDLANTVTAGIISAKQRPITAGGDGSDVSYVDALQTDAPINPGNSGGPLVDGRAHVIGINSAIRAAGSGDSFGGEQGGSIGLGFAIPINQGKRVAEELINTGRATHPVIGVTLDMGYSGDGARVSAKGRGGGAAVTPGGPGARAGIKAGDLITEVDGGPVHSGEELIVKIRSHRPGDRLKLRVERDGSPRTVEITLGSSTDQS
ncbi:S1C family serine protease [Streptomyces sp. NPDC053542]|uniref:S1C family serine protease n=1 Tax=Streptomyces sp. NPDC053542 TaxID=3365710 RepID=UPI0037D95E2D